MSVDHWGRKYADGQVVVRQGEIGDCMFAIQKGRLEVLRETSDGEVRIGVLEKGDIFGEMAIFEKEVRSATVRTLGEAYLLRIDKRTFMRRIQEDPSLALNLTRMMCNRIRRLDAELAQLRQDAAEKADLPTASAAGTASSDRPAHREAAPPRAETPHRERGPKR